MVRRECNAIERASNRPRNFLNSIDDFYARHCKVVSEAILPTLRTFIALHYSDVEYTDDHVDGYARFVAEAICENGKAELLDLSGTVGMNELRPAIERTTQEWLRSRSDGILRELAG